MDILLGILVASAAGLMGFLWFKGAFIPLGKPTRTVNDTLNPAHSYYIEEEPGKQLFSCSFIEFDDRGDFLLAEQLRHAQDTVKTLAKSEQPLVLIYFAHGWRNSSQSGNVPGFFGFLRQVANTELAKQQNWRVHGVYLGWRGAIFKPVYPDAASFNTPYDQNLIDRLNCSSPCPGITQKLETALYWTDKRLPEYYISGTSLSLAVHSLAQTAKRHNEHGKNKVFLIGHSFGGLLTERTFMNSTLAELENQLAKLETLKPGETVQFNPLSFDTVLLLNSASPSIYAKQFQDYLIAYGHAMVNVLGNAANRPVFISLTSKGDTATGVAHPAANFLTSFSTTLRRKYDGNRDSILVNRDLTRLNDGQIEVPQSVYYDKTPGHNPLLVNRWIEPVKQAKIPEAEIRANLQTYSPFEQNVRSNMLAKDENYFFTSNAAGSNNDVWVVRFPGDKLSEENKAWSVWKNFLPFCWFEKHSAYWIIRCPAEIIKDHNDIWNQRAMETYAAFFALVEPGEDPDVGD